MRNLFDNYLEFLWTTFMYDMDVFSKGWLYYLALIPAFAYLCFFMIKWSILMLPFLIPLHVVLASLKMVLFRNTYIKRAELQRKLEHANWHKTQDKQQKT